MSLIKKIGVLGCGWLGLPLAKALKAEGLEIKGSTTTKDKLAILAGQQIDPYLVQINTEIEGNTISKFLEVDLLIINIPPKRHQGLAGDYTLKMQLLADEILKSPIQKIIFVSSTSVYPENQSVVTEDTAVDKNSSSALSLFGAEEIFRNLAPIQTTIIRMAGLIGIDRHPGRFFAGKQDIPNGLAPINLIHLDDCLGIIKWVISKNIWGETVNGVAPLHPTKSDFYRLASYQYNKSEAKFIAEKGEYKIVSSDKLIKKFGYQFKIPDLQAWLLQTPQN